MNGMAGLQLLFLKDSVFQQDGGFSFNTLKITNTSADKKVFNLNLQYPENWQLLSDPSKNYTLDSGQNITLPIRIAASTKANSKLRYLIYAIVSDTLQQEKLKAFYYARVSPLSKWSINLPTPGIFFEPGIKETFFSLRIENTGNTDEELSLDYVTVNAFRIYLTDKVIIKSEKDTTIIARVEIDNSQLIGASQSNIIIKVKDKSGKEKTVLQQITSLNSTIKQHPFLWYTIPLYIELMGQNLTSERRSMAINSGGSIALKKGRSLSYTYRSAYISSNTTQAGSLANMSYTSRNLKLSVGDQSEFYANSIEGRGLKAYYRKGNIDYEAIALKRRDQDISNYGIKNIIGISESQKLINIATLTDNNAKSIQTLIYKGEYSIAFSNNTHLTTEAGYGIENINRGAPGNLSLKGQSIAAKFQSQIKKASLNISGNLSSKYYPTLTRGVSTIDNDLRFLMGKFYSGVGYRYTNRRPSIYENGEFLEQVAFKTKQYELKFGYSNKLLSTNFLPGYVDETQDTVSTRTSRIINSSQIKITKKISLLVFANAGRTHAYNFLGTAPFNSINSRLTLQSSNFGIIGRYDAGPYLAGDIVRYLEEGVYPIKGYFSPYVEQYLLGGRLYLRLQSDYINELNTGQISYSFRNELAYSLLKYGLRLKLFGTYNPQNTREKIFINAGIRKSFELPITGLAKYSNLTVLFYKDVNSNTLYDQGDELIPHVIALIDNKYFQTDDKEKLPIKI